MTDSILRPWITNHWGEQVGADWSEPPCESDKTGFDCQECYRFHLGVKPFSETCRLAEEARQKLKK